MKNFYVFVSAALLSLGLLAFGIIGNPETLTISSEASKIAWFAEKVTGAHNGLVMLKEGQVTIENDQLIGGSFVVDMTTLLCKDLDQPYSGKLERHLRSEDFFDVENHPTANFAITKVKPLEQGQFNAEITGKLTIKGMSHPISFPAKVKLKEGKLAAYGEMNVDRTKYNIQYGSSSFFEGLGDRAINDIFVLKVSIGAK